MTSPVPDLASTLTARNDSDQVNNQQEDGRGSLPARELEALRLLRESTENLDSLSRTLFAEIDEELREANERMSSLRREAALLRGAHDSRADERRAELLDEQRLTREHLRSMRDHTYEGWAPGTTENDVERQRYSATPSQIRYLREHARDTATRRHRQEQELTESAQSSDRHSNADDGMDWQTFDEAENGDLTLGGNHTSSHSLRTAALLQSVWRQARFNLEREMQSRDPERQRAAYHQLRRLLMQDQADRRARQPSTSDPQRQRRNEERSGSESEASKWLEEAIKHLERLRTCDSHSDRISSAAAGGFLRGDFFKLRRDDFILDTKIISPPRPTSWLRSGGIFSGSQHASGTSPIASFNMSSSRRNHATTPSNETTSAQPASSQPPLHPLRSSWISNVISRTCAEKTDDSWPVKVTVTSIDYGTMTMTGTMEAFNVPNKSAPVKENSITTYLEGEIIDFNRYTLETKSFNANSAVDSTYWRKLQPFKSLSDSEVVSNLVSRTWLCEELSQKWVLMRWKGTRLVYQFPDMKLTPTP